MDFKNCCVVFFDMYSLDPKVLSRRTPKFHNENLQALKKFLIDCRPWLIEDFTLIKEDDVNEYLNYMGRKHLSKSTIEGRIKTLRVFSRVLNKAKIVPENFAEAIKYRVKYRPQIIPFTDDQIKLLLKNTAGKEPIAKRMTATIMLFLDTGIRLEELYGLNVCDVDFNTKKVFLRSRKDRGQQYIRFGIETAKALLRYRNAFNIDPADLNAPFFQTAEGTGKRWAMRSIQCDLSALGKKANLQNVRCSPHTFRHSFALNALKNGVPELVLQRLLNHNTADMVRRYVKISNALADQFYVSATDVIMTHGTDDLLSPFGA